MREIKFRAWDKFDKEMVSWDKCLENEILIAEFLFNSERFISLQFTGLTDTHGKEIFEGDLLRVRDAVDHPYIVHIQFDTENGAWHRVKDYPYGEVIGNIYESPDLVKVDK